MEILPKSTTGSVSTRLSILGTKIFNTQKAPGINKLLQREVGGRGEEGQSGEQEIFPPPPYHLAFHRSLIHTVL